MKIRVVPGSGGKEESGPSLVRTVAPIHAGQRVHIDGRPEEYVVLHIDRQRHLADVLRQTTVRRVEIGVPLALLRPADEQDAVGEMPVSA